MHSSAETDERYFERVRYLFRAEENATFRESSKAVDLSFVCEIIETAFYMSNLLTAGAQSYWLPALQFRFVSL